MPAKLIASIFFVNVAIGLSWPSIAADRLRLGYSSVSALHGNTWIAEDKKFFEKHGVEIENIYMQGDPTTLSALLAGDVNFVKVGGTAVVNAALKSSDAVMIASVINSGVQRLIVRPEIAHPADLKGKKIGVTRLGSSSDIVLQILLKKWRMRSDDVQVFQVGSSPAMLAALSKGAIDGAVLTVPTFFVAEEMGYRLMADAAEMNIYYLHNVVATTRKFLHARRDAALRFMKAYIEGNIYFKKNRQESLEVLKRKLKAQGGQRYLEKSYDLFANFFDTVPYVSREGINTLLEYQAGGRKLKESELGLFVDNSLVKEIEASGFIQTLQSR
jgi:ABC-type nitrate/sulfonate/bicarbonate transport system substrate-binding protein